MAAIYLEVVFRDNGMWHTFLTAGDDVQQAAQRVMELLDYQFRPDIELEQYVDMIENGVGIIDIEHGQMVNASHIERDEFNRRVYWALERHTDSADNALDDLEWLLVKNDIGGDEAVSLLKDAREKIREIQKLQDLPLHAGNDNQLEEEG